MRVATTRKQRDMENRRKVAFTLQSFGLDTDEDGDPLTSCIVKPEEVLSGSLRKKLRQPVMLKSHYKHCRMSCQSMGIKCRMLNIVLKIENSLLSINGVYVICACERKVILRIAQ